MTCEHPMHDDDCPHGCEAPRMCAYCAEPAIGERVEPREHEPVVRVDVCESCAADLDRGAALAEAFDREQCRGDYKRDSTKMEFDR